MDNRVKFYSWLISLLERRRLTFEEIANEWRDANVNPEGEEQQLRTFHRYRKAIESQLGICVECSGKADARQCTGGSRHPEPTAASDSLRIRSRRHSPS